MDEFDALRAEVARHRGRARAHPLMALAVRLVDKYWRVGVGSPSARPYLDEAVEAFEEAYDHFEEGSGPRRHVAGGLGLALGMRHIAHLSPERDRDRAIDLMEEESPGSGEPSSTQQFRTLILANLVLFRALRSGDLAMRMMSGDRSGSETADLDRAVTLLREIVDGPQFSADLTTQARTMLEMAEIMRALLTTRGGRGPGLDLGAMMNAVSSMQGLQDRLASAQRVGYGSVPSPFDFMADELATSDPLKRPVTVIDQPVGAVDAVATTTRTASPPPVPTTGYRAGVREVLPDDETILALIDGTAATPAVEVVDRLVARCWSLVQGLDASAADRLLLAVALYVRHRVDPGDGWGEPDGADGNGDARAAADHLLDAAADLLDAPSGTTTVVLHLAGLLGVLDRLAERFAPVVEALRTIGAGGAWFAVPTGPVLLSAVTGRFTPADPTALPDRIVVVGGDPVPAHPAGSVVRSSQQLVELARRERRPLSQAPVFVANPRGDRDHADLDAVVLRRTFFPTSTGLGPTIEHSTGAGTPDEVVARLDASLLHLGCAVTDDGGLELADGVLEAATIAATPSTGPGGIAILPPAVATAALAEALLAAGFSTVVGFREPAQQAIVRLAHFMLLANLVDEGREPAVAVAVTNRWLADPQRAYPEHLPPWLAPSPQDPDLLDPARGTGLVCFGV